MLNIIGIVRVIGRIFTAVRAFVFLHDMAADMKFCRCIHQFIVSLFFVDFFHFGTAFFADGMFFFMKDFLNSKIPHPIIMGTFLLTLVFRYGDRFFWVRNRFLLIIGEHRKLNCIFHNNGSLLGLSAKHLLFQPFQLLLNKCKFFFQYRNFRKKLCIFLAKYGIFIYH